MKISGFTMVRNAEKYYFPIKQSILSILPIVEEFIVALGKGEDNTRKIIKSINSNKIKIYDRKWDEKDFIDGRIFKKETDFALSKCNGDWAFYLQADEVVHEKYLDIIKNKCQKYINKRQVEGLLFKYKHFWGDNNHYVDSHGWYPKEIRVVKNNNRVYSYKDAISFRIDNNQKLNVVEIPAYIYHYGWVRPPYIMRDKKKEQDSMHWGKKKANEEYKNKKDYFDYGPLGKLSDFDGTHPRVMKNWIEKFDWKDKLNYGKELNLDRKLFKHEKIKYKILTFIENNFLNGKRIADYKNYNLIKKED